MAGECSAGTGAAAPCACVGGARLRLRQGFGGQVALPAYRRASMVSRVERTQYANWWWTVDRLMLAALAVLMLTGIVLSLAASPAVATRIGLDAFYFVNRQAMFLAPS